MQNTGYFSLSTAHALGTPTETVWAQVFVFDNLTIIIVLEKNESAHDTDLKAYGKQVFVRVKVAYEASEKRNLATLRRLLETLISETTNARIVVLAAAMVVGKALYVVCQNGEVLIRRGIKLSLVLKAADTLTAASGLLEDGDVIVLISSECKDALSVQLEGFFAANDPHEVAEALLSAMHTLPNQERLVASVTRVSTAYLALPEEEIISIADHAQGTEAGWLSSFLSSLRRVKTDLFFAKGKVKRVFFTVFLLLLTLFIVSLLLGIQTRETKESGALFDKTYKVALEKYEEGIALSDLNPALAVKTLREAKDIIEKSEEKEKLSELSKKIDEGLFIALRIEVLADVSVFFDLTLIKEAASGTSMSVFADKMVILDKKNSALYSLSISTKKGELVSALLSEPMHEAIGVESGFILGKDGIEKVVLQTKKRERIIAKDEEWGEIGALAHFASNLYLLDKAKGRIYKYQSAQEGFGRRLNYLPSDVQPDFGNAVSMAIDGAIWVLFSDGRISKFVQGVPESFIIQGIDTAFSTPSMLFNDDESEHLYILDKGNKRVVVAQKDGTYVSQYVWEGIKDVADMIVSEKEKKILLLSGSKIYAIDIR